jgi:hypothetical protein
MDQDSDSDPDPAIFLIDLQDAIKNEKKISAYYFLKVHYIYIIFSKIKSLKEVTKQ